MSFSGFSEDDIQKINKGHDKHKGSQKTSLKKVTFKPSHSINNASKPKTSTNSNAAHNNCAIELPENARLSAPEKRNGVIKEVLKTLSEPITVEEKPQKLEEKPEPVEEKKFKNLEEFEARQKLIEEQNRKRKELLAKALADRTKRTQEEAQRLDEIQKEFKKLDDILSNDVKILRHQIELASIDYMECQKRYHRIEKEFLDAKLLLHQKQEKKEMLTEHLCTIIEKNEERKAEKLDELLQKLQLSTIVDEINETNPNVIKESMVEETK